MSSDPVKQERIDQVLKSVPGGKKKWVRYDEGAVLYSMGIHAFTELAKEAKAIYRIRRIVLVNTEKLDEYIEMMYGDPDSD
ncbi:MAG: hypothetical protein K6G87_10895 [Butyrivibrio sp.]|nr:DUF6462 family protein [Butyrivibrio sp.]MCR5771718.1 hypothetical protein [Butyrivibrio sp.]